MRIKVCAENQLAEGGVKAVKVLARNIAVFKIDGVLYGLEADCKHMRASIAHGKIDGTIITCPAHAWRYDITTGECLNEPWAKLKSYPIEIDAGEVYVIIG